MTRRMLDMTSPEIEKYMGMLAGATEKIMPMGADGETPCRFVVVVFDQPGVMHYTGNGNREDIGKALGELSDKIADDAIEALGLPPEVVRMTGAAEAADAMSETACDSCGGGPLRYRGLALVCDACDSEQDMPKPKPRYEDPQARLCPGKLRQSLFEYAAYRIKPGSFLQSVIANDLTSAVMRADHFNQAPTLHHVVAFAFHCLPAGAWGSKDALEKWCEGERRDSPEREQRRIDTFIKELERQEIRWRPEVSKS